MLFSVYAENQANIIEYEKKRQAEFGVWVTCHRFDLLRLCRGLAR
jgi:hypothetical protein